MWEFPQQNRDHQTRKLWWHIMTPGWPLLGTKPERLEVNWGALNLERKGEDPTKDYKSTQKTSRGAWCQLREHQARGTTLWGSWSLLNALFWALDLPVSLWKSSLIPSLVNPVCLYDTPKSHCIAFVVCKRSMVSQGHVQGKRGNHLILLRIPWTSHSSNKNNKCPHSPGK